MSSLSETRRASSTAPSAQHASSRSISGMFGRSGHTFKVTPITSWPSCLSKAAVTELSTPPDMPTITLAIASFGILRLGLASGLGELELDELTRFVFGVRLGDAPGTDDGRIAKEADQDVRQ